MKINGLFDVKTIQVLNCLCIFFNGVGFTATIVALEHVASTESFKLPIDLDKLQLDIAKLRKHNIDKTYSNQNYETIN